MFESIFFELFRPQLTPQLHLSESCAHNTMSTSNNNNNNINHHHPSCSTTTMAPATMTPAPATASESLDLDWYVLFPLFLTRLTVISIYLQKDDASHYSQNSGRLTRKEGHFYLQIAYSNSSLRRELTSQASSESLFSFYIFHWQSLIVDTRLPLPLHIVLVRMDP